MTKQPTGQAALLTGVIGAPIAHSLSPLIHNYWLRRHGIDGVYAPFHVSPESFAAFIDLAPGLGFKGLNVTAPLKALAYERATERSPRAERARSVNTLSFREDGSILGDSTDGFGFLANLEQSLREHGRDGKPWRGETVAILGAGGAVWAVAAALIDDGAARLRIANRTRARAEEIAEAFPERVEVVDWPVGPAFFSGATLLVNGVTLGAETSAADWPLAALEPGVVATDLVYAPLETPFLAAARAAGATIVDGLGMLLHQARPGFQAWHGVDVEVTPELRALVLGPRGCLP